VVFRVVDRVGRAFDCHGGSVLVLDP